MEAQDFTPSAVCRVRAEFDKALLFQPGQKPGNRWVGQMKLLFNVPGTGRRGAAGEKAQNRPLGGGKLHLRQGVCHRLIHAPMEHPKQIPKMAIQKKHPFPEM